MNRSLQINLTNAQYVVHQPESKVSYLLYILSYQTNPNKKQEKLLIVKLIQAFFASIDSLFSALLRLICSLEIVFLQF